MSACGALGESRRIRKAHVRRQLRVYPRVLTRKVYLPAPYVFTGATVGQLSPTRPAFGEGARAGGGLTGAVGMRFNIDEIATVGVEYNVVKDLVNKDPALGRLMFMAGIKF